MSSCCGGCGGQAPGHQKEQKPEVSKDKPKEQGGVQRQEVKSQEKQQAHK